MTAPDASVESRGRTLVWHLPAAAAYVVRSHPRTNARGRAGGLRFAVADGSLHRAGRARGRHARRMDGRERARRAHLDDPRRSPRAVRPVPSPGAARQDGRDARRDLGRPARARHRMGIGAGRARDVRLRPGTTGGSRREAARDPRDPRADVRRRALRLRRRALPPAERDRAPGAAPGARSHAHRRRRAPAHDAARRASSPTGGTARVTRSIASTSCVHSPGTRASRPSIRSVSRPTRAHATR